MPILEWLNKEEATHTVSKLPYRILKANPELSYGEKSSNGKCLFLMVVKKDDAGLTPLEQIQNKIRKTC